MQFDSYHFAFEILSFPSIDTLQILYTFKSKFWGSYSIRKKKKFGVNSSNLRN